MTAIDPQTLLAGAAGPHGRHERTDEGWDPDQRTRHGDQADALVYGRHAQPGKGER